MPAPPTGYGPTAPLEHYAHHKQVTSSATQAGYPVGRGMRLDCRFAIATAEPPLGRWWRWAEIRESNRRRRILPTSVSTKNQGDGPASIPSNKALRPDSPGNRQAGIHINLNTSRLRWPRKTEPLLRALQERSTRPVPLLQGAGRRT